MSTPFIAEIKMFAGDFAPVGFAFCDGQVLPASQNSTLNSIIGNLYGGNGTTTVGLPDLRGRSPIGAGTGPGLTPQNEGDVTGSETVTLVQSEIPAHSHALQGLQNRAALTSPVGAMIAVNQNLLPFAPAAAGVNLASTAIASTGGGGSHNNLQPYGVILFIIALAGANPPRP